MRVQVCCSAIVPLLFTPLAVGLRRLHVLGIVHEDEILGVAGRWWRVYDSGGVVSHAVDKYARARSMSICENAMRAPDCSNRHPAT